MSLPAAAHDDDGDDEGAQGHAIAHSIQQLQRVSVSLRQTDVRQT